MFFIEALVKYLKKDKFTEILEEYDRQECVNHLAEIPFEDDISSNYDGQDCEHVFMPVDSTGEILACTKCGQLISRSSHKLQNKKS